MDYFGPRSSLTSEAEPTGEAYRDKNYILLSLFYVIGSQNFVKIKSNSLQTVTLQNRVRYSRKPLEMSVI